MDKGSVLPKQKVKELSNYIQDVNIKSIMLNGLYASAKSFAIGLSITSGIHLIVTNRREDASGCVNDLYSIIGEDNVFFFPPSKDFSTKVQRTAAVGAVIDYIDGKSNYPFIILVAYRDSFDDGILDSRLIKKGIISIRKGDNISHDFLKELLFESGFTKTDFVSQPGEFAVRGSIIDLFSFGDNYPYRIDFFGDEVESIKQFNANTQRSEKEVTLLDVYPNLSTSLDSEETLSILEFLPKDSCVWLSDVDDINKYQSPHKHIFLSVVGNEDVVCDTEVSFKTSLQPSFNKNFELLSDDIKQKREEGFSIYILSESISQIERLKSIFLTHNLILNYDTYTIQNGFIDYDTKICLYTDHQIFNRYRRIKLNKTVERSERLTINDLNAFHEGDFIVHIDHGVGRYGGLVKNNVNGKIQEAVKLIYKDNDIIFVSIHSLHRISKYKSASSTPPKIYKLGTGAWQKLKNNTKSKVKDIAADLIRLYAQRKASQGFAFSPDSYLQKELESSFIYEETPDQLKALKAIKGDMEKSFPMDRLVCGDVGFGKTEVAIRAAFKAVADSKQVAVLVPTTILALQHFNTFLERLKNFPCNIDYVSRLRTNKEVKEIAQKLKEGKIDIIIGTHRLLNKEFIFKDLGLLIIDEEQKFGVAAKERLRQMKLSVDTLTLSATPIPRTLQFSLLGARDLSIINTPPPNRIPVHTEIIDFDESVIKEIINTELERGGQIFFVHNRIEDIFAVEDIIRRISPGIRSCVAHGRMEPSEIEKKVLNFMDGEYDILISTTIVENGIDIPNANTIIINKAQDIGLSDLHQLRGRVGRSNRKAYCYLIVPPMASLTDEAKRRLHAIEAFSDLGSGFNIAMQDLDIRGMGNMLGAEQSGFMADMGFETYQRILAEAFEEIKYDIQSDEPETQSSEPIEYVNDCLVETDLELLIPDSYINIQAEKIRLYKELDNITDEEDLDRFINELKDRFGPIPNEVKELCFVVRLRRVAKSKGFEKVVLKNGKMLIYFISNQMSPYYRTKMFSDILKSIQQKPGNRYILKEVNNKLYVTIDMVRTIEGAYKLISNL